MASLETGVLEQVVLVVLKEGQRLERLPAR
jgi:hypothetical protein